MSSVSNLQFSPSRASLAISLTLAMLSSCGKRDNESPGITREQAESGESPLPNGDQPADTQDLSDNLTGTESPAPQDSSSNDSPATIESASSTNHSSSASSSTSATDQSDGSSSTQDTSETTNTSSSDPTSTDPLPPTIPCGSKIWSCGDGIDNDSDGKVDLDDPECTSPCDDTEDTFATNLPGQNSDCKADCYFDSNSGAGDDKCEFNLKCDAKNPGESIGCAYDSSLTCSEPTIPAQCLDYCTPLIPNGCDCFGCCGVKSGTETVYISLSSGSACNLENLGECSSCTFNTSCSNTCVRENCELCFGDETLPENCTESSCPSDVTPCTTSSECQTGQFCLTGCCTTVPG